MPKTIREEREAAERLTYANDIQILDTADQLLDEAHPGRQETEKVAKMGLGGAEEEESLNDLVLTIIHGEE